MKRFYYLMLIPLLFSAWQLPAQLQVAFNPATATMNIGEERTFNLVANSGFSFLVGVEFTMTFDTNRLEFVDAWPLVDTVNTFKGIEVNYYDGKDLQNPSGYGIKVLWIDENLSPKSLPAGTPFIAVKLRAKSAGSSMLRVLCDAQNGYNCEVINAQFNNVGISGLPANITVSGNINGLTATIGSETGPSGSTVCIPVTVNNFTDVALMEFGISWDPFSASFVSVTNCNPTLGLDCVSDISNNNNFGLISPSILFVSWFTPSGSFSLPNGTVLFELCLQVTGSPNQFIPVNFYSNPNPSLPPKIEFRNENGDIIPANTIGGGVTIGTLKNITLDIDEKSVCSTDTVCVPVRTSNFKNMEGLLVFITADPTKLDLVSVKGCNPKLQLPSCNMPSNTFFESNDTLGFLFLDPNNGLTGGITLDSNEIMFQLCYQNLMAEGDSAFIKFTEKATSDPPILAEALDTSGVIGMIWKTGKINSIQCNCNLAVTAALVTNVKCNGGTDGAINLIVSGGSGNFTYVWNPTLPNTKNPTGLAAGTYKVTIIDNTIPNCTWESGNININQPQPFNITGVVVHESCIGEMDGSVTLTITGSNPGNVSVNWGGGKTGNPILNLSAGTYTPTVTDPLGCTAVGPSFTVNSSSIAATSTSTNVTCFGAKNGTITLDITGSGSPFTVTWLPAGTGTGTTVTNLGPGMYTPTVSNSTGCVINLEPIQITEPTQVEIVGSKTDVACNGGATGSIILTTTGGAGNYTYVWNGNITTKDRFDLVAGSYSVTVIDAAGCTRTNSFIITNLNPALTLSATTTIATPNQSNGGVTLTVNGGLPGYTYQWAPDGQVTKDLTNVPAGTYTVTVTDAAGCTKTLTATVPQGADGIITFQLSQFDQFNVSCNGECDGTAVAFPPGSALQPVTYKWGSSAGGSTSAIATDLCAGSHSITITDATGKQFTGTTTLTGPQPWTITGQSNGEPPFASAFVFVSGPLQQPYTFLWNTGDETESINNLQAGKYCVTVTNFRGCTKSTCVEIFDMECLQMREIITPNGDGQNDQFVISCIQDERYMDNRLDIFNRWGQLVYTTTNYTNEWTGMTLAGTELPEGAYYYVLEYTPPSSDPVLIKGSLNIIR